MRSMKDSRDQSGHHTIYPSDTELAKNAKATINLLRSIDAAIPLVITPAISELMKYAETGSSAQAGEKYSFLVGRCSKKLYWGKNE